MKSLYHIATTASYVTYNNLFKFVRLFNALAVWGNESPISQCNEENAYPAEEILTLLRWKIPIICTNFLLGTLVFSSLTGKLTMSIRWRGSYESYPKSPRGIAVHSEENIWTLLILVDTHSYIAIDTKFTGAFVRLMANHVADGNFQTLRHIAK